jgi:hypothetical protein
MELLNRHTANSTNSIFGGMGIDNGENGICPGNQRSLSTKQGD